VEVESDTLAKKLKKIEEGEIEEIKKGVKGRVLDSETELETESACREV
jgi:hypothetical protein